MRKIPSAQTSTVPKTTPKAPAKASLAAPVLAAAPQPVRPAAKAASVNAAPTAKATPTKTAKTMTKTAKTIPVQAVTTRPAPVRIIAETPATYFAGVVGRAWRMSGKHAVAYVQNAALAGELLATEPRLLVKSAMAVYYDRKGRPFAWQVRFDSAHWDEVIGKLA